jgi:DNA-binding MarR family transcriptional regulator
MDNPYLEVVSLVERLHRQFLEVVKLELEGFGIHDINNVQAMMLFNIGDAEMTVGELTLRGCYLGSNVSYNVKKMVENKYLAHERSVHDRRSVHVRLTEKGIKLRDNLTVMHQRHAELLSPAALSADDLRAPVSRFVGSSAFGSAPPIWCSDRSGWHRMLRLRLSLFSPDA